MAKITARRTVGFFFLLLMTATPLIFAPLVIAAESTGEQAPPTEVEQPSSKGPVMRFKDPSGRCVCVGIPAGERSTTWSCGPPGQSTQSCGRFSKEECCNRINKGQPMPRPFD